MFGRRSPPRAGGYPRHNSFFSEPNRKGDRQNSADQARQRESRLHVQRTPGGGGKPQQQRGREFPRVKESPSPGAGAGSPALSRASTGGGGVSTQPQTDRSTPVVADSKPAASSDVPVQEVKSQAASGQDAESKPTGSSSSRKFTNKCRLFIGNLPNGMSEADFRLLFSKYGEISEVYLHSQRNFGFVRLDTRANAERAKEEMDGKPVSGRDVRVRFAAPNCTVSVEGLHPLVSNELLEQAFLQFGPVERAIVWCDERGKSMGKGQVDFVRRNSALNCVKACTDGCFLLTKSPQPVIVKAMENNEDVDGVLEKSLQAHPSYTEQREVPPHFARPGSFEFDVASQWKALAEAEKAQRDLLEKQIRDARQQMHTELEQAMLDNKAEAMRQELQQRQEELQRFEEHRRVERSKFSNQQRRHESQRREEYYQQQSSIMRQHGASSKVVEGFLRGRHQQLDDMFRGQGPPSEGNIDGSPMVGKPDGIRPPLVADEPPMEREGFFGRDKMPPPPLVPHGMHHPDHDQPPMEGDPQWQNIAMAVSHIQNLKRDDRGGGHGFHPGDQPHGFPPHDGAPLAGFRPDQPPLAGFRPDQPPPPGPSLQPRGPHSHPPGPHGRH